MKGLGKIYFFLMVIMVLSGAGCFNAVAAYHPYYPTRYCDVQGMEDCRPEELKKDQ
jgi:hypothetical protein